MQLKDRLVEYWEIENPKGHAEFGICLGDGDCVAEISGNIGIDDGYTAAEIARRLTACWNALKGWDIESIEAVEMVPRKFV